MRRLKLLDHPQFDEIMDAIDEGQSAREIAVRYKVETAQVTALLRKIKLREEPDTKKAEEVVQNMEMAPEEVAENLPATRLYGGVDVAEEMLSMYNQADSLRRKALQTGQLSVANSAMREKIRIIEAMTKISERMRKHNDFNPWNHPDVVTYQQGLLAILRKHPKALEDVIEYIERFGSRSQRLDQEGESE